MLALGLRWALIQEAHNRWQVGTKDEMAQSQTHEQGKADC